jgi:RNA polymerase sigma-70 factor, ECF subfamily
VEDADLGLIAACQQGDQAAFRRVFELYRDRVYGLCRQMAGNDQDAEDLAQEAFVTAFRHLGSYRGEAAFGTWLYRVTANCCLSQLRRRRSPVATLEVVDTPAEPAAEDDGGPQARLEREELAGQVSAAVAELPESQRLIFVLGTQLGMRYREIAEISGCSEEAVKVRMHRARKRVRDALLPYLEG